MRPSRLAATSLVISLAWLLVAPGQAGVRAQAQPAAASAPAACSKAWVGREAEFEEYLRAAPIDRIEDVPIGVTTPKRAFFKPGGPAASAAWKPLKPGIHGGFWDSYRAEIAAYELDKLLGLQMVPPAVERTLDGQTGALVYWVEDVKGWKISDPVQGPDQYAWSKEVVRMKMFDDLIGNNDRNQGNLIYDPEYHLILIDHSRALTTDKKLPSTFSRVDRRTWERMDALTYEQVEAAVGAWIGKGEVRAILERRDKMREEIKKLVAKTSEPAVFMR